ncbi:MAG: glycosyltransferase [Moorea sp. SIO1G6]|uniref:glycosyltransferase n=1 Tax=Moorena sp. SIO1G6 TaxID=2607840 RepID=UPI0013C00505|nr:glycosyltransferase [Moorena sp. SIO1G6]NES86169.1 glycosyltransferase [Moorena sp. SIO2B7]NET64908.1 glycosyltransferase [Moorena sp. SIO1G6]
MTTETLVIVTSIAPGNVKKQQAAINSWLTLGFEVVSLNIIEEIEKLQPLYQDIKFHRVFRDGREHYGKPYVYIDDLLSYLRQYGSQICGIVNADIILKAEQDFTEFIREQTQDSILLASRVDIDTAESINGEIYDVGVDVFFFEKELLEKFPSSDFCLGIPFWDFWVPVIAWQQGLTIKDLVSPVAYHVKHSTNYSYEIWQKSALKFTKIFAPSRYNYYQEIADINKVDYDLIGHMDNYIVNQFLTIYQNSKQPIIYKPRLPDAQNPVYSHTNTKNHDYNSLVWLAWSSYYAGNFTTMAEQLKNSLTITPYQPTETISDWIEQFTTFSAAHNSPFNSYAFSNLTEWQYLIRSTLLNRPFSTYQWQPKVSIITSVFKGDKYIEPFLKDITQQTVFAECELILVNPNSPGNEEPVIKKYMTRYQNIIYIKLDEDPGLYEVWNMSIRLARGHYITNANLDDRRAPRHIEEHMRALDEHPDVDVVCAPLKVTMQPNETWDNNTAHAVWYVGFPEYFGTEDFFQEKWWAEGEEKGKIGSQNLPHCMPVWRKSVHEKNGYFDEIGYGASADWEFWLRCSTNGSKFMLLREPLGIYLEDPQSYNRRFESTVDFEKKILQEYYVPLTEESNGNGSLDVSQTEEQDSGFEDSGDYPKKLDLASALQYHYGEHRSGWSYAMNSLKALHNDAGILVDGFIEKKFAWGSDPGDCNNTPTAYTEPWIGFIHCPPYVPKWFQEHLSPQAIFASQLWQESIKYCQGLFCLSEDSRQWLQKQLDVPIVSVIHPTETPDVIFSMDKFLSNPEPTIIQIGIWLRKMHSIYYLPVKNYKKMVLRKPYSGEMLHTEKQVFNLQPNYSYVQIVDYLPNDEYDEVLSKNIAYLELYDTSANNAIIECIVRNTPVLVNPLPAVKEYLGQDYPLYFQSRQEAAAKADDFALIEETHHYLKQHPIKEKLTSNYFLKSIVKSEIYKQLS